LRLLIGGVMLGFWGVAGAASLEAPLEPAGRGQLQCYQPDVARKTCQSLAGYRRTVSGGIDNLAVVLVSPIQTVVMTSVTPVEIKAGQVCGAVRAGDIAAASFTVDGKPASAAMTDTLRRSALTGMKIYIGHEICTAYVPEHGTLRAAATVDGVRQAWMDQKVVWVSQGDGYRVGP
jgi:hypothetical protein